MMVLEALTAGAAHFVFVFFKAAQQRNVAFMHYAWIMPVSMAMSTTEVFVLSLVAVRAVQASSILNMWPFVVALSIGGGLGAILSMWAHNKFIGHKK
jgi:hypothetical protein